MLKKLKNNKLIKNGILYSLGGILLQGINFFTIPIFTRLLSPNDYGIISLYSTWMGVISIFIVLQTYGTIGNAKIIYDEEEFSEYVSNSMVISVIAFLFWIIIFLIFKKKISIFMGLNQLLIFFMLLQSFFNVGITYKITLAVHFSEPKKKLLISILSTALNVGLSIYLIKNFTKLDKYMGRIVGGFISTLLIGGYFFLKILLKRKPTFKKEHFKFCLKISVPLIFHNLSHLVLNGADRVMLEKFTGIESTGIYSFTYNIGMIISVLWISFNSAWIPWFYENMKNKKRKIIEAYSIIYLYFFTFLCAVFLMLAPEFIKIMAPKNYWSGIDILPWIALGYYFVFYYSFPVNYEFYHKKTSYVAIGTTFSALINIILNFYFIPKYEVKGAALTTFISYAMLFIFHEVMVRKKMKDKILDLKNYMMGFFIMILTICIYYKFINDICARYFYILIVGFLIAYVGYKSWKNKEEIR